MNTCIQCHQEFETYKADFECRQCDDGMMEVYRDWTFGEPELVVCDQCHGEGSYQSDQTQLCCEDCREQYFYPGDWL